MKGIKREFSVARTPHQNRVTERKNRTLIEAARTMLADSKLPTTFWAEAVTHNKTPYELFLGRKHALSFMRPFGYPVTILNTIDHQGKFDGKVDEGFFIGFSTNSKVFRVFNNITRIVEEDLHVQISKNTPNIAGSGPNWLFDIDALRNEEENKDAKDPGNEDSEFPRTEEPRVNQEKDASVNNTNTINTVSTTVNTVGIKDNAIDENIVYGCDDDPNMPELEEIVYSNDDEDVGVEVDINNLDTHISVRPILTTRIHKDYQVEQITGDIYSAPQTRRMTKSVRAQDGNLSIKISKLDKSYARGAFAVQVTTGLDLGGFTNGKRAIGSKWVYRNKKDEKGIMVKNKARLVAQGYT
ncbi:putative ribonuclease H-like domain-containing protein [Tanacetum coccineum]